MSGSLVWHTFKTKVFTLVWFAYWNSALKKPVGILEVTVLRAKNLLKMDVMGKADPYVKLQLVNTLVSKKTHTKKDTLNPEWNETFKFLVQDPKSQSLEIQVYDWDKVS